MANPKRKQPTDEDEEDVGSRRESSLTPPDESLDEFLGGMFQQTATGDGSGMPTLDWLKTKFKTKSAAIRYLHEQGHSVNEIRKHLNLKYQHVRNVLTTQLKRGPNEDFHLGEGQIIEEFKDNAEED